MPLSSAWNWVGEFSGTGKELKSTGFVGVFEEEVEEGLVGVVLSAAKQAKKRLPTRRKPSPLCSRSPLAAPFPCLP